MDASIYDLLKQIATNSGALNKIASNIQAYSNIKQEQPFSFWAQIIASFFVIITALIVAYLMPFMIKLFQKPKLRPLKILKVLQTYQYIYRLTIKNDSNFIAKNVEIDIEGITDDGGVPRENFIPAPLRWTHRDDASRDVFPHQTAYLDICAVKREANKFITLAAPNIEAFPDMVILKSGTTNIKLRYYNENGQAEDIKIKVVWNGNETFNDADLPKLSIVNKL